MTCCGHDTALALADIKTSHTENTREEALRTGSHRLDDALFQTDFVVPDMHCAGCISRIEKALTALPHVTKARANLSLRRVRVIWAESGGCAGQIDDALTDIGFDHYLLDKEQPTENVAKARGKALVIAMAVAGFASANIMLLSVSVWSGAADETARLFHIISALIAVPAVAIAGRPFFSSALKALSARRLNMDVPISLAVLMALGMGLFETLNGGKGAYFDACVMLLFFLLIGRYLDHLMREKARNSVESLARITSKGGLLVGADGQEQYIALKDIEVGQVLRVLPGERFPVDGRIISGSSDLDRSLVTGESTSVSATIDDTVEAGVLNLTGPVDMIATTDASSSFTAEIMKMMTAAENGRSRYVRIAERAATFYAPAVHIVAFITFIAWMVTSGGDWKTSLYVAIAVLIITCPCALGLAVPVVHVIGANRLLKEGILMRDGSAFERLAEIETVVFDKTGTLTDGKLELSKRPDLSQHDSAVLAMLARASSHPVALALHVYFKDYQSLITKRVKEFPGYGVEARFEGIRARLGRPEWVTEIARHSENHAASATTAFAIEGNEVTLFEMNDVLRPDAVEAGRLLRQEGLSIEIVSGDRAQNVAKIAADLGIENFMSNARPKDKVARLELARQKNINALMVGDGLNDAPALAAAHVSMAPASASEVGRSASDFVFTRPSLIAVPFAFKIAKRTGALVRQNLAIAVVYNCVAVPLAMAGQVTPLIAALAMSLSSIAVVGNSMRLNFGESPKASTGRYNILTPMDMSTASQDNKRELTVA